MLLSGVSFPDCGGKKGEECQSYKQVSRITTDGLYLRCSWVPNSEGWLPAGGTGSVPGQLVDPRWGLRWGAAAGQSLGPVCWDSTWTHLQTRLKRWSRLIQGKTEAIQNWEEELWSLQMPMAKLRSHPFRQRIGNMGNVLRLVIAVFCDQTLGGTNIIAGKMHRQILFW